MIIGRPRIEIDDDARLTFPVSSDREIPDELWFAVAPQFVELLSPRADGALVALLNSAMQAGEDIHVTGALTDTLLANAAGELQDLLLRVSPDWRRITVTGDEVDVAPARASAIALAFSGGVDSFASLNARLLNPPFPSMRVTHLLYTNVGSHEPGGRALFLERFARLAPIADALAVPFVRIDSNLSDFYRECTWEETHVLRNVAAGMALQAGVGHLLHSATYDWSSVRVEPAPVQSRVEPILAPLLSTDAFTVTCLLGGRTRLQKMRTIASMPLAYEYLDVCTDPHGAAQCGRCVKCQRALLALELLGAEDRFGGIFDLEQYRRGREDFIGYIWASPSELDEPVRMALEAEGIGPAKRSLAGRTITRVSRFAGRLR